MTFDIRPLSSPGLPSSPWNFPSPVRHANFLTMRQLGSALQSAISAAHSLHLVPVDPNLATVDSVVYKTPNDLRFLQITVSSPHPINVVGLQNIQSVLKIGTSLQALRPSTSSNRWPFIFVVPMTDYAGFKRQPFMDDTPTGEWAKKVNQFVLGIDEDVLPWGPPPSD